MHSTIKFTAEISAIKADFLDTTVYMNDDGSLWTDLFCKPTDTHSYLRYESSHPPTLQTQSTLLPVSPSKTHMQQGRGFHHTCPKHEITFHWQGIPREYLKRLSGEGAATQQANTSHPQNHDPPRPLRRLVKKLRSMRSQLTILLNKISVRSLILTGIYLVPLEPKNYLKLGSSLGTADQRTSGNILSVQP